MTNANAFPIYEYQMHVTHARARHPKTVNAMLQHIWQFLELTGNIDFRNIDKEAIVRYKDKLQEQGASGKELAPKTIVSSFGHLKDFFEWLAKQPGYENVPAHLHEYFTPQRRLVNSANAPKSKDYPSHEEILLVVGAMPANTFLQRRNRALIAFAYLSGARVSALITLQVKHVDVERRIVEQMAIDVHTKRSKNIRSAWFPVGDYIEGLVIDWIAELKSLGAKPEMPLFPRGARKTFGPKRETQWEFIKESGTAVKIFTAAALYADVERFTPHRVRDTISSMIFRWATNLEEVKALSQSIGHDNLKTTLDSYGALSEKREHELISGLRNRKEVKISYEANGLTAEAHNKIQLAIESLIATMISALKT